MPVRSGVPDGWPVGDPPRGSSVTASVTPGAISRAASGETRHAGASTAISPSDRGTPPAGIAHSSAEPARASSASAASVRRFVPGSNPIATVLAASFARNTAIDRLRVRHAIASPAMDADEAADPSPAADADLIAREDDARLHASLDGLDPGDAAFLRTAFLGGMTYADLATRENLPLGTVKSRIRRALLKLRERLT